MKTGIVQEISQMSLCQHFFCFDTDCNGATVGSVLGTAIGYNAIPSYWKDRVNDTLESTLAGYGSVSIGDMAEKTLSFIKKN